MQLNHAWTRDGKRWLIDGHGSVNRFLGFVEVNDNDQGDAEEAAALIVRAVNYYQRHANAAPLWEIYGRNGLAYYHIGKPDMSEKPRQGNVLDLEGEPVDLSGDFSIEVKTIRCCQSVPMWWESA